MVLLAKSKLNSLEVLISKALIGSVISHDKEYNGIKERIKNLNT